MTALLLLLALSGPQGDADGLIEVQCREGSVEVVADPERRFVYRLRGCVELAIFTNGFEGR